MHSCEKKKILEEFLNSTDKSASSPTHQTSRSLRCDLSETLFVLYALFISGSVHYKLVVCLFYTALSEAVPSIIMTVILSDLTAASATQPTPQLLLTKWSPRQDERQTIPVKAAFFCCFLS